MSIVFIGASKFGLNCLISLVESEDISVSGVITNERNFSISYARSGVTNVLHADFSGYCHEKGIDCYVMRGNMKEDDLLLFVRERRPKAIIVVGWYHLVSKPIRDIAPAYGMHASLLPDYSGGAPLVWALINGESRTGITLFQLADGVDNGPIVAQASVSIDDDDDIATLYAKIEVEGLRLLVENAAHIAAGAAVLVPQDESRRRTFPQRAPQDGIIDWTLPAWSIRNFIRAQTTPYPGAFTELGGGKLIIWNCTGVVSSQAGQGAFALDQEGCVTVNCGDAKALRLDRVQWRGVDMSARSWFLDVEKPRPVS